MHYKYASIYENLDEKRTKTNIKDVETVSVFFIKKINL